MRTNETLEASMDDQSDYEEPAEALERRDVSLGSR